MDLKAALEEQYGATLLMLRQAVERCPEEVWLSGGHPRSVWRIAYHAVYYTHLYLGQNEASFQPWAKHRDCSDLWEDADAPVEPPFSQGEILEYVDELRANLHRLVDALDLSSTETGFSWYPNMTKLSHQLLNLRHLQGHVGQLSEILLAHGVETDWISRPKPLAQALS
jgi:hypothetical protein